MQRIIGISAAVCISGTISLVSDSRAQSQDKFTLTCSLPFDDISVHRAIDKGCAIEGAPRPEDGAVEANKEQNRAKNNFCATGAPVTVTRQTFQNLETKVEALETTTATSAHPFTFGSHAQVPEDRTVIRSTPFYTTSDGDPVHEGTLVRTVAYIMEAKYSSTSGEL